MSKNTAENYDRSSRLSKKRGFHGNIHNEDFVIPSARDRDLMVDAVGFGLKKKKENVRAPLQLIQYHEETFSYMKAVMVNLFSVDWPPTILLVILLAAFIIDTLSRNAED